MGAVSFSLDHKLVASLKTVLPLNVLVETGTFRGDTVATLADQFDEVHTVELSPDLFQRARQRFAESARIQVHHGQSPEFLRQQQAQLEGRSILYWLDAHWCVASGTSSQASQCPLLDELSSIERVGNDSVILIDDARLYLCPPPEPHETSQWPGLDAILKALYSLSTIHEVMVVNDVIAFFPPKARDALYEYSRANSVNWLLVMKKASIVEAARDRSAQLRRVVENQRQRIERLRKAS